MCTAQIVAYHRNTDDDFRMNDISILSCICQLDKC